MEWKKAEFIRAPLLILGNFIWQRRVIWQAVAGNFDAFIFLANPYYLSTWVAALAAKLRGKRVLFWTHGWIAEERGLKALVRDRFLRAADALLLYGERARSIGRDRGFRSERLYVIYNSLDYERQLKVRNEVRAQSLSQVRDGLRERLSVDISGPIVICTARLIRSCRFDLLIDAVAKLRESRKIRIGVVLVGDGPERADLESRARAQRVDLAFMGACYDESVLGRLLYASDVTVSPGKVGLTAIHSLMYGTPVITHDRFDRQFPEVEAIKPGRTGEFFACDDADSLADVLGRWLERWPIKTVETIDSCFRVVDELYNPATQRRVIEMALEGVPEDA
jgi:glycosyltransferase involved in cell wall biosynthesis